MPHGASTLPPLLAPIPPATHPCLPPTADIDETVARGLDFIIAEAAKHGIRLTLVLLNLWKVRRRGGLPEGCLDSGWRGGSHSTRMHTQITQQ